MDMTTRQVRCLAGLQWGERLRHTALAEESYSQGTQLRRGVNSEGTLTVVAAAQDSRLMC